MTDVYFLLWTNRHGQRLWDGPYMKRTTADATLDKLTDKSGGYRIVEGVTVSSHADEGKLWLKYLVDSRGRGRQATASISLATLYPRSVKSRHLTAPLRSWA